MSEIQQNRYDALLRRVCDLKGPGSKVNDALGELFPVLEVEDLTTELLALGGWRLAWQSTERPAVAAKNSASQLRNPAGSGALVVVTELQINTTSDQKFQVEVSTTLFGTPVAGLFRDARFGIPRGTAALVSSADDVAVGGGLRLQTITNRERTIRDDNGLVVLTPGTALNIGTVSDTVLMTVNYFWRERIAEPSELSF